MFLSKANMRIIFEIRADIYNSEVSIEFYLRIRFCTAALTVRNFHFVS